jgi:hypothetical protein
MNTKTLFLIVLVVTTSCKKENNDVEDLFPIYQAIVDVWKPQTMSYDSMGVRVTKSIQYDKFVINDNLSYQIYPFGNDSPIEDGAITIITQTNDRLEISFTPDYPMYSSFAGSHIFAFSTVVLESLTNDEMILNTGESWQFENVDFHFTKY